MLRAMLFGALLCAAFGACAEEFLIGCWTFMSQERSRPVVRLRDGSQTAGADKDCQKETR